MRSGLIDFRELVTVLALTDNSTVPIIHLLMRSGLIDFQNSVLGHADRFEQIQKQLDAGGWLLLQWWAGAVDGRWNALAWLAPCPDRSIGSWRGWLAG